MEAISVPSQVDKKKKIVMSTTASKSTDELWHGCGVNADVKEASEKRYPQGRPS